MVTGGDMDGRRMTICPACGYPSAGLCAACTQICAAAPLNPATNTVAGGSRFDPAA